MNAYEQIWRKLAGSKSYREAFAATQAKRAIPAQIRALMSSKDMSQEKLAKASGLTQGVISRAANPNYGNLALNTIVKIAAGFDLAFIGQFVPFSELARWSANWSEEKLGNVASFEEEKANLNEVAPPLEELATQSPPSELNFPSMIDTLSQACNLSSHLRIAFRNPKPIQSNMFETPPQLAAFDGDKAIKVEQVNARAMANQGAPQWQMTR